VNRDSKQVGEVEPATFPDLKLWERQDLEAWVTSAPELAGGDFTVVTSEYDRFDRTSERLNVLGVLGTEPGHGRLVVVELKRDGTSTTVDLQAIKYAAYVAAAQFSDVVGMYARHHAVSEDEARAALLELLGGTEDEPPVIDDTPRIVLVAGDFRPEVTTTVMWLIDNFEMDIRCVRLQPFAVGDRILVHSEVIIPLPEAEQYRLGVQRKRREAEHEQKARAGRLLPRLLEAEALELGQVLYFRRDAVPPEATPWSSQEPLYQATLVSGEGNRTLEWTDPESGETSRDSPSLLAARLLHRLGHRSGELSSSGINGMHYWTIDGETSLRDLAAPGEGRTWDEQSLFADLIQRCGEEQTRVARELYDWMRARGWRPTFGRGKQDGSWIPVLAATGRDHYPIALYTYGRIEVQFQHLKVRAPFDDEHTRLELLARVNEIANVSLGPEVITKRPSIPLSLLASNPLALEQLQRTIEWVEDEARKGA
jgi:hypothetical protein